MLTFEETLLNKIDFLIEKKVTAKIAYNATALFATNAPWAEKYDSLREMLFVSQEYAASNEEAVAAAQEYLLSMKDLLTSWLPVETQTMATATPELRVSHSGSLRFSDPNLVVPFEDKLEIFVDENGIFDEIKVAVYSKEFTHGSNVRSLNLIAEILDSREIVLDNDFSEEVTISLTAKNLRIFWDKEKTLSQFDFLILPF